MEMLYYHNGGVNLGFCGEIVRHRTFGRGKIVKFEDNRITVLFDNYDEEKTFQYPSSFGKFLEIENRAFIDQIEVDKEDEVKKENELKKAEKQRIEDIVEAKKNSRTRKSSTPRKTDGLSNIAFKCNYCDGGAGEDRVGFTSPCTKETIEYNIYKAKHVWCGGEDSPCYRYLNGDLTREELVNAYEDDGFVCYESKVLNEWRAYAGIVQTGKRKGSPMTLRNARGNSLALLTTRLPHAKDKDRFIFAVFLIDEDYRGDRDSEGCVGANPKYRIKLSPLEAKKLKFWNYYFNPNRPEKIVFGSGLHRYLSNTQSAQILRDICELKKGTNEEDLAREFFEHYCDIKKIDIENLPQPEGGLKRAKDTV